MFDDSFTKEQIAEARDGCQQALEAMLYSKNIAESMRAAGEAADAAADRQYCAFLHRSQLFERHLQGEADLAELIEAEQESRACTEAFHLAMIEVRTIHRQGYEHSSSLISRQIEELQRQLDSINALVPRREAPNPPHIH
ncbi:hypothetical protein CCAX7_55010 [Capsulimonas corticalis]|uniref:Uncharacterized protein n=1 Tax=Capsulimonas corticalis TaxID=2219043 RepID=A0A402D5M8_9BACT|nr:hypothetical protein [Capsulimonas corticalis]BDI33450.1 hypothetical protein CCAX7_55010 [Capsulimonas corticalis]